MLVRYFDNVFLVPTAIGILSSKVPTSACFVMQPRTGLLSGNVWSDVGAETERASAPPAAVVSRAQECLGWGKLGAW
jgi:hypothetical protein